MQSVTADELALDLGMLQDDDVRHLVSELVDLPDEEIPAEVCGEVRDILDVAGVRTAPANLYWAGHVQAHTKDGPVFRSATHQGEPVWLWEDE